MTVSQDQKKIWAGLKRPTTDVSEIKTGVDALVSNGVSWDDFYDIANDNGAYELGLDEDLLAEGLTEQEVDNLIAKIKAAYPAANVTDSWVDFQSDLDNYDSYQAWKTVFGSQTTVGGSGGSETSAGVKVYPEAGTGEDGQSIPADGVEIIGTEVHFSQAAASPGGTTFTVSNFRTNITSGVAVTPGTSVLIEVDVANDSPTPGSKTVTLTEDGTAIDSETADFFGSGSQTIGFTVTKNNYDCFTYAINGLGNEQICWEPTGVGGL